MLPLKQYRVWSKYTEEGQAAAIPRPRSLHASDSRSTQTMIEPFRRRRSIGPPGEVSCPSPRTSGIRGRSGPGRALFLVDGQPGTTPLVTLRLPRPVAKRLRRTSGLPPAGPPRGSAGAARKERPQEDPQQRREEPSVRRQAEAHGEREGQNPLSVSRLRKKVIHQPRRGVARLSPSGGPPRPPFGGTAGSGAAAAPGVRS